jgi:hypothetical protein
MKLMGTNQRRALKRRRKLMPEPRRVSALVDLEQETTVVRETVSTGSRPDSASIEVQHFEQPDEDRVLVQN